MPSLMPRSASMSIAAIVRPRARSQVCSHPFRTHESSTGDRLGPRLSSMEGGPREMMEPLAMSSTHSFCKTPRSLLLTCPLGLICLALMEHPACNEHSPDRGKCEASIDQPRKTV